jgi:competence protein ComEC
MMNDLPLTHRLRSAQEAWLLRPKLRDWPRAILSRIEQKLEEERDRIALWLPIALAAGITAWYWLPGTPAWVGFILMMLALAGSGYVLGLRHRIGQMLIWGGIMAALGCGLIWWKAEHVAAPILARPIIADLSGTIEGVERRSADKETRLIIAVPLAAPEKAQLPPRVRVTVRDSLWKADELPQIAAGQIVSLKVRLMPPPRAMLPGGYDFAQRAWFDRIGAVGTALTLPILKGGTAEARPLRDDLADHIRTRLNADQAGLAIALATGDQGAISDADAEAMRQSGLAHLLSISGLHVTAMVAAVMFLLLRIMALSPMLALRWPLLVIAAAGGALAGIGYTWITGAQVPTVRSCIAALLVLAALVIGREAITMRLLAAGAIIVLLISPQALFGPSFQLSFAAIAAIMAVHEHPRLRTFLMRRDEGLFWRSARGLAGLLITGLAVEIALMPIALFHFHKAGAYGAAANLVAIPMTTFIIMPLEALALALDGIVPGAGLGAPLWWLCGQSIACLIWLAHWVSSIPGSMALIPSMTALPFALFVAGGLWFFIMAQRWRFWGVAPAAIGVVLVALAPSDDLFITSDGRHVATRLPNGSYAVLRGRAGEFVRDALSEASGMEADMPALDQTQVAKCSTEYCVWRVTGDQGRSISILASRSTDHADWRATVAACAAVDIVISDRWLPRNCIPRLLKADRKYLDQHGGLTIDVDSGRIKQSRDANSMQPWDRAKTLAPIRPNPPLQSGSTLFK